MFLNLPHLSPLLPLSPNEIISLTDLFNLALLYYRQNGPIDFMLLISLLTSEFPQCFAAGWINQRQEWIILVLHRWWSGGIVIFLWLARGWITCCLEQPPNPQMVGGYKIPVFIFSLYSVTFLPIVNTGRLSFWFLFFRLRDGIMSRFRF